MRTFNVYFYSSFVGNYTCEHDWQAISYIANRDFGGHCAGLKARAYN
jgi:hypothetical protein